MPLHTSKRMHFIEEDDTENDDKPDTTCIRQNVCTSLRKGHVVRFDVGQQACIRQNVCTSLRSLVHGRPFRHRVLHTSKRMHFIEDWAGTTAPRILSTLAYVKTYALH